MIIHYQNRNGMERVISNVIHFQNIGNETFEALMENGTTLTLRVGRIEGIYGRDRNETKEIDQIRK